MLASLAIFSFAASAALGQAPTDVEIRFCPQSQVRPFPLESQRGIQSLLLQNAIIINRHESAIDIADIWIELTRNGNPVDSRRINGDDLARASASGPALQKSGMLELLAFQFCGTALIPKGVVLAGPTLLPGQALLLSQQPFAYRGQRDTLNLRVHARMDGQDIEARGALPIKSGFAQAAFRFPLRGTWFAAVGPTMHTGHRWALPEEFGYDMARLGKDGATHRGSGERFAEYYAYGAPVIAAADGRVVAAVNDEQENSAMLRRPGERDDAYGARVQEIQATLLRKGTNAVTGNHVVIDHGGGEYSLYAHLRPGSVRVKIGDRIAAGAVLGRLGSSGNSTEPHLHFQVCDAADPLACAGIPVEFTGVRLPYADYPRQLQSGDVVIAK